MGQDQILRRNLRRIHVPLLGGGGDQHRLGAGAGLTQLIPGAWDGGRASRALVAIELGIDLGLLHHDVIPVGIEFIGNDHAKGGFDSLADLRAFGINGDRVIRGDADEGVQRLAFTVRGLLCRERWVSEVEAQHKPCCSCAGKFEEGAPSQPQRSIGRRHGADLMHQRGEVSVGPGKAGFDVGHWVPPGN